MFSHHQLRTFAAVAACSLCAVAAAGAQSAKKAPAVPAESQATLRKEAKVSEATARKTALHEVPAGKIQSSELERENGKLIYSFDIKVAGKSGIEEVNVDAVSGAMIAHEHETPKAEKKEAAQEAKEKRSKKS